MNVFSGRHRASQSDPICPVVRIAATGDLHIRGDEDFELGEALVSAGRNADVLLLAGDLTESGRLLEAEAAANLLASVPVPVIAVLGNHDRRSLRMVALRRVFERSGIEVLDGAATVLTLPTGSRIGIAGTTGSGGGFWPVEGPVAVHARAMKRLALRANQEAAALDQALSLLATDARIALMHFSPTTSTLGKEPIGKYWMLGNSELGAVIDRRVPDLVVHGHAHLGNLCGLTPGQVPVRNVALPVVGHVHFEEIVLPPAMVAQPVAMLHGS
ncbi:MAG: metallophosphoesterase [Thermomicrobiales bacterium]